MNEWEVTLKSEDEKKPLVFNGKRIAVSCDMYVYLKYCGISMDIDRELHGNYSFYHVKVFEKDYLRIVSMIENFKLIKNRNKGINR